VRDIIMSMLAKNPEDRPRSAASLARIIEELLPHLDPPQSNGDHAGHTPTSAERVSSAPQERPLRGRSEQRADQDRQRAEQSPSELQQPDSRGEHGPLEPTGPVEIKTNVQVRPPAAVTKATPAVSWHPVGDGDEPGDAPDTP